MRFQIGCNKVVIELRVVQFWSEIIITIINWSRFKQRFVLLNGVYLKLET